MQKRKFKLNILDIAIVILVICAVVALSFRDTISDMFTKPDIVALQIDVSSDGSDVAKSVLTVGNTVVFQAQTEIHAVVSESDGVKARLNLNGYKKLGRYYTENGDPISVGDEYVIRFGDLRVDCRVEIVETKP